MDQALTDRLRGPSAALSGRSLDVSNA